MKSSKILEELRGQDADDIRKKVVELKEELMRIRFRKSSGQQENVKRASAVKRDIARALTVLKEKEQAAA